MTATPPPNSFLDSSKVLSINGESLRRFYGRVCFGRIKPGFSEQEEVTVPYVSFTCATQTEIIHFLIVQGLDISNQDTWQEWLVHIAMGSIVGVCVSVRAFVLVLMCLNLCL